MTGFVLDDERPDLGGNIRFGDIHTWCPKLWDFIIERYAINSMLDVGCGEGHAARYFHRKGVISHGIDGLITNVRRSVFPIAHHDILSGPYKMPVDLVWSCEVAEHIAEDKVDFYLDTLANGRFVAMTHALPGQAGHNHVNCQTSEYWVEKMKERGYAWHRDIAHLQNISNTESSHTYFSRSGLFLVRL